MQIIEDYGLSIGTREILKNFEMRLSIDSSENSIFYINQSVCILENEYNLNFMESVLSTAKNIKNRDHSSNIKNIIEGFNGVEFLKNTEDAQNFVNFYVSFFILKYAVSNKFSYKEDQIIHSDIVINTISSYLVGLLRFIGIKFRRSLKIDYKKIRKTIWCILESLVENNLIKRNYIRVLKKKSLSVYTFPPNLVISSSIEIYFSPFALHEEGGSYYIHNKHYSSLKSLFMPNEKSGKIFEFSVHSKAISNLLDINVFVDEGRLGEIFYYLCGHYGYNEGKLDCEHRKLLGFLERKYNENDVESIKSISKKLSILEGLIRIRNVLKVDLSKKKVFFPIMFDFRSRKYSLSDLSPTFYKEFRYCLFSGYYNNDFSPKEHVFSYLINNTLDKYLFKVNLVKGVREITCLNRKRAVLWILISCSELIKSKIGSSVPIEKFIDEGIEMFNNRSSTLFDDPYDKIRFNYLCFVILDIFDGGNKMWLISKDATGSCFQHLIKIMGPKNEESLSWTNLKSLDTWYDPYMFIINAFKKKLLEGEPLGIDSKIFESIFSRKNLKKTIMTENYSAGLECCWRYFSKDINYFSFNNSDRAEIRKLFNEFYKFIHNGSVLIRDSVENMKEVIAKSRYEVSFEDGGKINLSYFMTESKEINLFLNGKRLTRKEGYITTEINVKKTAKALVANFIQSLDASLVRWLVSSDKVISIHDCFLIDYMSISYLLAKINEGMRLEFQVLKFTDEKINTNIIFSIFIVI